MFFSTLNRPKSCHVLRNLSDDEDEETKDEQSVEYSYKSTNVKEPKLNDNEKAKEISQEDDAENNIDTKSDMDGRLAIRENTFVTNEPSSPNPPIISNTQIDDAYKIVNPRTQILLINFPPSTFELQLSRHKRLNFDQVKADLTVSRRGVFIVQSLRWVSKFQ